MDRARMEAVSDALGGVLDAAERDVETLEWARSQLDLYIGQLRNIPTEIHTKLIRRQRR